MKGLTAIDLVHIQECMHQVISYQKWHKCHGQTALAVPNSFLETNFSLYIREVQLMLLVQVVYYGG